MRLLRRLAGAAEPVLAPELLRVECASVLAAGVRRRRWSGAEADAAYAVLTSLPLHLVADHRHLDRAWELSRRYDNHPVYDMLYVATAEAAGTDLITTDATLLQRLARLGWVRTPEG